MARRQCAKCPWRKDVDPTEIPNGYSEAKHANLKRTIRNDIESMHSLIMMACHETHVGKELPCVGWLMNQLTVGNNFALRLRVMQGKVDADVQLVGEQHETFEDTLPKNQRKRRRSRA